MWWIDNTLDAWEAAKLIGALVMSSALFPAYGLARLVVSRPWALFAAAGTVAVPALAFAPYLMDEPLAYPVATLGLFLIVRAARSPRCGPSCSPQGSARSECSCEASSACSGSCCGCRCLRSLGRPGLYAVALGLERWDWTGVVLLAIGAAVTLSAVDRTPL